MHWQYVLLNAIGGVRGLVDTLLLMVLVALSHKPQYRWYAPYRRSPWSGVCALVCVTPTIDSIGAQVE